MLRQADGSNSGARRHGIGLALLVIVALHGGKIIAESRLISARATAGLALITAHRLGVARFGASELNSRRTSVLIVDDSMTPSCWSN